MSNSYFKFKQFTIHQDHCAMKVTTDSCLFGAWVAKEIENGKWRMENLLDIGSGTGLLSLMIAQKNKIKIDAVEIDEETAKQSLENIAESLWAGSIKVFHQNILEIEQQTKYDCIVSNPPFYENEWTSLQQKKNIAHHSVELNITQLLQTIRNNLSRKGIFFLLLPYKREKEIHHLLKIENLFINKEIIVRQSLKHSPFRIMIMASIEKPVVTDISEIYICANDGQYSSKFISLLKDYYLHL